jgi:hypothetical protein
MATRRAHNALIADSAGPLTHATVTVDFRAVPEDVSQAYAVVVPE